MRPPHLCVEFAPSRVCVCVLRQLHREEVRAGSPSTALDESFRSASAKWHAATSLQPLRDSTRRNQDRQGSEREDGQREDSDALLQVGAVTE